MSAKPPIAAAEIDFAADPTHPPRSRRYDDLYHPVAGALAQARHVFLEGNDLPRRWQGRARFTILETGFGFGLNALATIAAWRGDPTRCARLHLVGIEAHPPSRDDLRRALAQALRDEPPDLARTLATSADELIAAWPPLVPGVHRLRLAEGAVTLDLIFADVHVALRESVAQADAFFLDGFAPTKNPRMWDAAVFRGVARLAADDATAATWSVARVVRDGLDHAGFVCRRVPGFAAKRDALVAVRRPLPTGRRRHDARARLGAPLVAPDVATSSPHGQPRSTTPRIVVLGAGLAGAHVASALVDRGLTSTVIDRHAEPASEASGGEAGIFHGTVHADDHTHARIHRAASLAAAGSHRRWRDASGGTIDGALDGLLRRSELPLSAMQALQHRLHLPDDWVRPVDLAEARALAGVPVDAPCWLFPRGGWISPRALVRHLLARRGVAFDGGIDVAALARTDHDWVLQDAMQRTITRADIVVLANAQAAAALAPWASWPLHTSRGQSTTIAAAEAGLVAPRVALGGHGYAVALPDGRVLCGASSALDDPHPQPRAADTHANLVRLARLTGTRADPMPRATSTVVHRVAWRCVTPDRLPIVGAVPAIDTPQRPHPLARVPRAPGLYVATALGSRGLTLAPWLAEIVASMIQREPLPVERPLLDAIDAARFVARPRVATGQDSRAAP